MRILLLLLALSIGFGQITASASTHHPHHKRHHTTKRHHANKRHATTKRHATKPKNEITKIRSARKTDHTVRQVTVDPKKSPGKHADNLSKNVNHEINRESKDVNHFFQGKHKKKP